MGTSHLKITMLKCIRIISQISTKLHDVKQRNVHVILYEADDSTDFTIRTSGNLISLEWSIIFFFPLKNNWISSGSLQRFKVKTDQSVLQWTAITVTQNKKLSESRSQKRTRSGQHVSTGCKT